MAKQNISMDTLWESHTLVMRFVTPLCGGVPRSDKVLEDWAQLRAETPAAHSKMVESGCGGPDNKPPRSMEEVTKELVETNDTLPEDTDAIMAKSWVGFRKDETGLFVPGGSVRAHLKDGAGVLGRTFGGGDEESDDRPWGRPVKQFASKLKNATYIREERVYVRDPQGSIVRGVPLEQAPLGGSGWRDATQSVMTAQGPRTCLKRVDMVFPATLTSTILLLRFSEVNLRHIQTILVYLQEHGFGQDRSLGYGKYVWKLDDVEGPGWSDAK